MIVERTNKTLEENGWKSIPVGYYRTTKNNHHRNEKITGYNLFVRKTEEYGFLSKSVKSKTCKNHESCINTGKIENQNRKDKFPYGIAKETFVLADNELLVDDKNSSYFTNVTNDVSKDSSDDKASSLLSIRKQIDDQSKLLPELNQFSEFPSLANIRRERSSILIGYDSEWETVDGVREMISWQYAVIWENHLWEFCFIKDGGKNLDFYTAIGCILDKLGIKPVSERRIKRYEYCTGWNGDTTITVVTDKLQEAKKNGLYIYHNKSFVKVRQGSPLPANEKVLKQCNYRTFYDYSSVERIPVTIVCHAGKVDLSAISYENGKELLKYLTDVHGGVVTLRSIPIDAKSLNNPNNMCLYPIQLSVADTMCHAPAGKKKLADLGAVVGVKKIEVGKEKKERMLKFLREEPLQYLEYASTDSVVTLMYASSLYGYNKELPATITSASAGVMKKRMMKELGCNSTEEFNRKYRGLKKVSHGLAERDNGLGYLENSSLEPISDAAHTIQHYASQAYHGGYNGCSEIGYFPCLTHDYDLKNAYPTAMCLVPDIDWENPIRSELIRQEMRLSDFCFLGREVPITPFVGYVRFEFPESVKYPCIPVNVEGVPIYPRTSDGMDGVYVAGPFVWLALKLGAKVFCDRGYFLNTLCVEEGESAAEAAGRGTRESRSIAFAVKQMVVDRGWAKEKKGKGSLEDLVLKEMVNSGYGKNAQNVIEKHAWTAYKNAMESLGCSAITNPVSAMMTTAIVQTELLAIQNQLCDEGMLLKQMLLKQQEEGGGGSTSGDSGYRCVSVTTDGFITDCPLDYLNSLDMYGLKPFIEQARMFLVGNTEVWEEKHRQDDLVNFTTRGNVSLRCKERDGYNGVCAHNSTKSGYESDSYEDRLWLMTQVLSRTGPVKYTVDEWPSFKDIALGAEFIVKQVTRKIRMDFDMKRKPARESFVTDYPVIEGVTYEIAHFDTIPFESVEEFILYREKKALCEVLRTKSDWEKFFQKVDLKNANCKAKVRDMDWAILNSCVMGHRAGRWKIPGLDAGSVEEKCEWINQFNKSKKRFKKVNWEAARKPDRQANMLPEEFLKEKLREMGVDM